MLVYAPGLGCPQDAAARRARQARSLDSVSSQPPEFCSCVCCHSSRQKSNHELAPVPQQ
jgi:hypothetical protein